MTVSSPPATTKVATCRHPRVAGPGLPEAKAEDGMTTAVKPTFDAEDALSAAGRVYVKAFGAERKACAPGRALQPMMPTTPRKAHRGHPRSAPPGRRGGAR